MNADPVAVAACFTPPSGNDEVNGAATINGVAFTKFVSSEGDAGHTLEFHSYRTLRSNRCYAIEYNIRLGNIGMYGPGSPIVHFDKAKVENVLAGMVLSFKFR